MPRLALCFLLAQATLIGAAPTIGVGGVVNSADYSSALSTGGIFSIYGSDLAPGIAVATETPLPTVLAGVSVLVTVDGRTTPAPLFFVSGGQINAQMPYATGGRQVQVQVRTAEGLSNTITVQVLPAAPRFYTKTLDGRGEAILLHADYSFVSEAAPARPGEVVILYLAGLGEVAPAATAGVPAGNGGDLGPLNAVPEAVMVSVAGRPATVYWAGLAPGFAGLYQVNFEMPQNLPGGMAEVAVFSRGAGTQSGVMIATFLGNSLDTAPEEVLLSAFRAQAAGDVEGFLAHFALSRFSPDEIEQSRRAFTLLRDNVGITELEVRPVATGYGDLGNLAVVRAETTYRLTSGGFSERQTDGVIAIFVGENGAWKILSLDPDHLLNLEIDERGAETAALSAETVGQTRARAIHEINALLNGAMMNRNMNGTEMAKLTADANFAFIGRFPGLGDAVAQVYQVGNLGYDLYKTGEELLTRGFTPIFALKATQVVAGGVQIAVELVPGADSAADAMSAYVEEVSNRHELKRAVREFQREISYPLAGYNAHVYLLPEGSYRYPGGIQVSLSPTIETAYGRPPQAVALTTQEPIGHQIPFQVIGEIPLASELERFAEQLGAKKIDGVFLVPVDVSMTVNLDAEPNSAFSDPVLTQPQLIRSNSGGLTAISYLATCTRGFQNLTLPLTNGAVATGPEIIHKYMNEMADLQVRPNEGGKVKVGVGQTVEVKVFGIPSVAGAADIDLTDRWECLRITSDDEDVFSFVRGPALQITGESNGEAPLRLQLPGPFRRLQDQFPAIEKDVPVEVGDSLLPALQQTNFIYGNIGGLHRCMNSETGQLEPISFGITSTFKTTDGSMADFPVTWNGGSFRAAGNIKDANRNEYSLLIQGDLDPSGRTLISAQFELLWKLDDWESRKQLRERTIRFTASNLPLTYDNTVMKMFDFSEEGSSASTHVSGLTYLYRFKTQTNEVTCTYAASDWSLGPHVTVSFDKK